MSAIEKLLEKVIQEKDFQMLMKKKERDNLKENIPKVPKSQELKINSLTEFKSDEFKYVSANDIYKSIIKKDFDKPYFNSFEVLPFNHTLYNRHLKDIKDNSSVTKVSSAVQSFITSIIKLYAKLKQLNDISFGSSQDLVNASDNTLNKRDFICYFDGVPIILGEVKAIGREMDCISKELEESTGFMSPIFYNQVPFVLCYIVTGSYLQFFAYIRCFKAHNGAEEIYQRPRLEIIGGSDYYNLRENTDRLKIFKIILNAMRFYHGCRNCFMFPKNRFLRVNLEKRKLFDQFETYIQVRGDEKTGGLVFVKRFEKFSHYSSANYKDLLALFGILKANGIRHTYRDFNYHYSSADDRVIVKSRFFKSDHCIDWIRSNNDVKKMLIHIAEALIDLHEKGFVHRDLQLANIAYDESAYVNDIEDETRQIKGEFLLVNFDSSGKDGDEISDECEEDLDVTIKDKTIYTIKDDIHYFGSLIVELTSTRVAANVVRQIQDLVPKLHKLDDEQMTLPQFICELKRM